jgi:hypothetical protein
MLIVVTKGSKRQPELAHAITCYALYGLGGARGVLFSLRPALQVSECFHGFAQWSALELSV